MKLKKPFPVFFIMIILVQLACNAPSGSSTPDTFATLNGLYTASVLTQQAGGTLQVSATPGLPIPTTSGTPSSPVAATNTSFVSNPVPVSRCDAAAFLSDATYADGSLVARNSTFVKIWRIKNVGTCTWTTSYAVVFSGGDSMSGPGSAALTRNVAPGETYDLAVTLTSPGSDGRYRGYWKLRNASGTLFGIGNQADIAFWVD